MMPLNLMDELASIAVIIGGAWLLGFSNRKNSRSWFSFFYNRHNRIDNIYQLLPILQKNSKVLFLIFNDIAVAVNSLKGPIDSLNDEHIPRDIIKSILSQEHFLNKIMNAQNAVLNEFGTDSYELNAAMQRFSHDDQVELYRMGVDMMYNSVLDGGYPQCPGVEVCDSLTREDVLRVLEQIMTLHIKNNDMTDECIESSVIMDEMRKYGALNELDSIVLFKNTENIFNYDFNFMKAKCNMIERYKSILGFEFISKVSLVELDIIVESAENDAVIYLLIYSDIIVHEYFNALSEIYKSDDKAIILWSFKSDLTEGQYQCPVYPSVVKIINEKIEVSKLTGRHLI